MLWRRFSLSLATQREKALVGVRRVVASAASPMATRKVPGGKEGGGAMGYTASLPAVPAIRHPRCRLPDLATCPSQIHSHGGSPVVMKKKGTKSEG